jgi:hypothetical protein
MSRSLRLPSSHPFHSLPGPVSTRRHPRKEVGTYSESSARLISISMTCSKGCHEPQIDGARRVERLAKLPTCRKADRCSLGNVPAELFGGRVSHSAGSDHPAGSEVNGLISWRHGGGVLDWPACLTSCSFPFGMDSQLPLLGRKCGKLTPKCRRYKAASQDGLYLPSPSP